MDSGNVLVLRSSENERLTEALFRKDIVPIVRGTLSGAVEEFHRRRFSAIVVDCADTGVDALEFVLNIRDIDPRVPIIVVGKSPDETTDELVLSQNNTTLLSDPASPQEITAEIERVLSPVGELCPQSDDNT